MRHRDDPVRGGLFGIELRKPLEEFDGRAGNKRFTLKERPMTRAGLDDFAAKLHGA